MKINNKIIHSKNLYIFFLFLSLNIFFFSTVKSEGKAFDINDIDISRPFEINFDKNDVINEGFKKAFSELVSTILNSKDQKKIDQIKLNQIKGMIETFTIKEEKFIDETYHVNLGVSFNKKKVFNFLEKKNIFPSIPQKKTFLFIPIIIDENKKNSLFFYNNKIFLEWNNFFQSYHLIEYLLPEEDLEDLNIIKSKYEFIEKYDFKEIISKYNLNSSIVALIFKNEQEIRILSRITDRDNTVLKNETFSGINFENINDIENLISNLKISYEDYWKASNQINTSIRLTLNIKVDNKNYSKILEFENTLDENDLVYEYYISKFDKDFTFYQIIFNSNPNNFLKIMEDKNYKFNTQNKIWILK